MLFIFVLFYFQKLYKFMTYSILIFSNDIIKYLVYFMMLFSLVELTCLNGLFDCFYLIYLAAAGLLLVWRSYAAGKQQFVQLHALCAAE